MQAHLAGALLSVRDRDSSGNQVQSATTRCTGHMQLQRQSLSTSQILHAVTRRTYVKVQAVATTVGSKTVLAPPYNVLITGSTKGKTIWS